MYHIGVQEKKKEDMIMNIDNLEVALNAMIDDANSSSDFDYAMRMIEQIRTQLLYAHYFDISLEDKYRLQLLVKEAKNCLLESLIVHCVTGFDTDEKRNAAIAVINYMYHKDFHSILSGETYQEKFENLRAQRRDQRWLNDIKMILENNG